MPKEIQCNAPTGLTLYALIFNYSGQVWNGTAFVTMANSISSYAQLLAESALLSQYTADFPAGIVAAGLYPVQIRKKLTGSYLTTDPVAGAGELAWTGSAVATANSISASATIGLFTVTVTAVGNTVVLTWTGIPGATGYKIYRSVTQGGDSTLLDTVAADVLTWTDTAPLSSNSWYEVVPEV